MCYPGSATLRRLGSLGHRTDGFRRLRPGKLQRLECRDAQPELKYTSTASMLYVFGL
jgi:hypothetical protein